MPSRFGGIVLDEPAASKSRFGGVVLDQPKPSRFGGVPIDGPPIAAPEPSIYDTIRANEAQAKALGLTTYEYNLRLAGKWDDQNRGAITGSTPYRVAEDFATSLAGGIGEPIASGLESLGMASAGDARKALQTRRDINDLRDKSWAEGIASGVAQSLGTAASAVAVPGGNAAKLTAMLSGSGYQSFSQSKRQAMARGATEEEASKIGRGNAALEVGVTGLFQLVGLGGMEKELLRSAGWGGVKNLLVQTGAELTEEELTGLSQSLLNAPLNPNTDYKQQAVDIAAQTLLTMGLVEGVKSVQGFVENPSRQNAKKLGIEGIVPSKKARQELADRLNAEVEAHRAAVEQEGMQAVEAPVEQPPVVEQGAPQAPPPEIAPAPQTNGLADFQKLVERAWPKSEAVAHQDQNGELGILFKNGQRVRVRVADQVRLDTPIEKLLESYRMEDTPENRELFSRADGSYQLIGNDGTPYNALGLIKLRTEMAQNPDLVLRHELTHMAIETGMLSPAEVDALARRIDPKATTPRQKSEAIATHIGKSKPLQGRVRQWIDKLLSFMGFTPNYVTTLQRKLASGQLAAERLGNPQEASTGEYASVPLEDDPERTLENIDTATKNATTRRDATNYFGLTDDLPEKQRKGFQQSLDAARAKGIPAAAESIAESTIAKPYQWDDEENAGVTLRMAELKNEYRDIAGKLQAAKDPTDRRLLSAQATHLEGRYAKLKQAAELAGTEVGRALVNRKLTLDEDFDLLPLVTRAETLKGEKLTPEEKAGLTDIANKGAKLDKKIAAKEKKAKEVSERKAGPVKKAIKKLKEVVASAKLPTDLNKYAQKLAKQMVADGIDSRRELIDAVQLEVRKVFPETQRRQIIDAISNYGNFRELSKDDASVKLRDIKGQLRQISKLKDMSEGTAPKKTGQEHPTPSDTERGLIKEVNEAKKAGGYEITDPTKQLKSALDAIKTRLRNQIKDLQHQIDARAKTIKERKDSPSDEESQRLVKERDELKARFEEIFGKPEMTEAQRIEAARRGLEKSAAELERRLAQGDFDPTARRNNRPEVQELAELRAKREALAAEYQSKKPVSLDRQRQLNQSIKTAEERIRELERRLQEGDFSANAKRPALDSPKLAELRKEAAALKEKYDVANPNPPALQRAKERLAELENHLANGTLPDAPTAAQARAKNKALAELQQSIAATRKALSGSEPAQRARLEKSLAEMRRKLAAGEYGLPEKKAPPLSPELERLQFERQQLLKEKAKKLRDLTPRNLWDHIKEGASTTIEMTATFDFSAVGRQGYLLALSHPAKAVKALGSMFKATFSEQEMMRQKREIDLDPDRPLAARAKLYLADLDAAPNAREELFRSTWVDKIPYFRGAARASNRALVSYLNKIRFDVFKGLLRTYGEEGATMEQARDIARHINILSGRGDFGRGEGVAAGVAPFFYSARYAGSRFQVLYGQSLWSASDSVSRKLMAREYGKMALGLGMIYGLHALFAGDDEQVSFDPTDSTFGKIRVGDTFVDPLAGLSQATVLIGRSGSDVAHFVAGTPSEYGSGNVGRFLRSKLAPVPGTALDILNGKNYKGDDLTAADLAANLATPMAMRDVYDSMTKDESVPRGVALSVLSIFGAGVQRYSPKIDDPASAVRRRRNLLRAALSAPRTAAGWERKRKAIETLQSQK